MRISWKKSQDILLIILLCLCALKLTHGVSESWNLPIDDEGELYLSRATSDAPVKEWGHKVKYEDVQWGPLYIGWYKLLHRFEPNRAQVYYMNLKFLCIATTLLLFLLLRGLKATRSEALIFSFWYLISFANLPVLPKITHFAMLFVFGFYALANFFKFPGRYLFFTAIGLLIACYARPECAVGYWLAVCTLAATSVWRRIKSRNRETWIQTAWPTAIAVLLGVVTFGLLGSPLGGGRSWWALRQGFAYHYVSWTNDPEKDWINKWDVIFDSVFPGAQSPLDALLMNPYMVFRHLAGNVIGGLRQYYHELFGHYSILTHYIRVECALLAIGLIAILVWQRKKLHKLVDTYRCEKVLALLVIILPNIASIFLIHWTPHHFVQICFVSLILIAMGFHQLRLIPDKHPLLLAIALLAMTPVATSLWNTKLPTDTTRSTVIKSLNALPELNPAQTYSILSISDQKRYGYYLGPTFRFSSFDGKVTSLEALSERLASENVSIFLCHHNSETEKKWLTFLMAPEKFGFFLYDRVGKVDIFLRRNLFPNVNAYL